MIHQYWDNFSTYRKVASFNTSFLEAHDGFSRLLMRGIFDPYVLSTVTFAFLICKVHQYLRVWYFPSQYVLLTTENFCNLLKYHTFEGIFFIDKNKDFVCTS